MSLTNVLIVGLLFALVIWWGRRVPLTGARRWWAMAARLLACAAIAAALWAPPRRHVHDVPRHLIYVVDGSASIDASQTAWIARRIASLEALRPSSLERAVVAFGSDAATVVPFGHEPLTDPQALQRRLAAAPIQRQHTNLESGLLAALALVPPEHRGGVVLLSDGRETQGNVSGLLAYLRRLGLELFPVGTPVFGKIKTVWEELDVPPVVQQGSPIPLQLVVFNGSSEMRRGQVDVALEGVTVKRERIAVRPGWQVVTVSMPAIRRGTMALDVRLALPGEGLTEHRQAYTEVEGPPQVLFVSDRVSTLPALATALKRRKMEIAVSRPADLPQMPAPDAGAPPSDAVMDVASRAVTQLLDYDAIVLFNVPKSSLSQSQVDVLRKYVEHAGGGLVVVGLGGDLAHEINTPAPLDELLPVRYEAKGLQQAQRRVCMVMLIDRSASMIGPRIAATKRAAVELVKQLAPEDLVGILAFDTQAYVVAEVESAGQLAPRLVEKLVKLRSSGGTDVYPALIAASSRLEMTGATLKHIILLSDGFTPWHEQEYRQLAEAFHRNGTTVSTIGIGAALINTDYLEWLARSTGGTFYQMRNLDELPQLIARDTQQSLERLPFAEGYFKPLSSPTTDWFSDVYEWPSLRGFLTATAKPSARVDLTVSGASDDQPGAAKPAADPLLARWSVGTGRVVAFTSDADTRWSPDWVRWPRFDGVWAQVVRWAMRPRFTEQLFVWTDENGEAPQLVLEGTLHDPKAELISAEGSTSIPLALIQTGAWRWHASLEQIPSGWYEMVLESHEGAAPVLAKRWVRVGTPPSTDETPNQPAREPLLRQLARATGGRYEAPDRALVPPTTTTTTTEPMLHWWIPLAILALLIDIALRGASML